MINGWSECICQSWTVFNTKALDILFAAFLNYFLCISQQRWRQVKQERVFLSNLIVSLFSPVLQNKKSTLTRKIIQIRNIATV